MVADFIGAASVRQIPKIDDFYRLPALGLNPPLEEYREDKELLIIPRQRVMTNFQGSGGYYGAILGFIDYYVGVCDQT